MKLVSKGKKLVLEQLVTTLATVADIAEEHFVPYYDQFMPFLKFIMVNATGKDYRLLRGKTIECISLIGLAVGQDKVGVMHCGCRLWWAWCIVGMAYGNRVCSGSLCKMRRK